MLAHPDQPAQEVGPFTTQMSLMSEHTIPLLYPLIGVAVELHETKYNPNPSPNPNPPKRAALGQNERPEGAGRESAGRDLLEAAVLSGMQCGMQPGAQGLGHAGAQAGAKQPGAQSLAAKQAAKQRGAQAGGKAGLKQEEAHDSQLEVDLLQARAATPELDPSLPPPHQTTPLPRPIWSQKAERSRPYGRSGSRRTRSPGEATPLSGGGPTRATNSNLNPNPNPSRCAGATLCTSARPVAAWRGFNACGV